MADGDAAAILMGLFVVLVLVAVAAFGWPMYNVWSSEQHGRAELAQAEYNRQIAVVEANAKKEGAKSLAEAEIIRAEGVAKANQIIGSSLKGNSEYLYWLWVDKFGGAQNEVIYIPTESGFPILEAGGRVLKARATAGAAA